MFDNSIVIMTALVPTVGHQYLIDFASHFAKKVIVILCTRSFEPGFSFLRYNSFEKIYQNNSNIVLCHYQDDKAPQNISDCKNEDEFWNYWTDVVIRNNPHIEFDRQKTVLVASENYGIEFAARLGISFIPCDIARNVFPVKSEVVRKNIIDNFQDILPTFRHNLTRSYCFFGQESTGKTTWAKIMAKHFGGIYTPEWAREYLELIGPNITEDKMKMIVNGQYASMTAIHRSNNLISPFIMRDTDLLSTIGYYKIWNNGWLPEDNNNVINKFVQTKSDLYIVMPDDIPFEVDPLRYGGDKRESTKQFWINQLENYGCNYHVVKNTNFIDVYTEIAKVISQNMTNFLAPFKNFERE